MHTKLIPMMHQHCPNLVVGCSISEKHFRSALVTLMGGREIVGCGFKINGDNN